MLRPLQNVTIVGSGIDTLGGGIGLWRNSLGCYSILGLQKELVSQGAFMPLPSYIDAHGNTLASPSNQWPLYFPILSLQRTDLHRTLLNSLAPNSVQVGYHFDRYEQHPDGSVTSFFTNGESITSDLLIGADGIHSKIRHQMLAEKESNLIYCGAVITVSDEDYDRLFKAFESWGEGKRFGVVPLRKPEIFWFAAIQTPSTTQATRPITEVELEDLKAQFKNWYPAITHLIERTPHDQILRTEIFRVPILEKWHDGSVVLLGDSCHATAPNLAQGAGLAIEDGLELARQVELYKSSGRNLSEHLKAYEEVRRPRAVIVQNVANAIAWIGQIENPGLIATRNNLMKLVPQPIKELVFELMVRFTLGWNYRTPNTGKEKSLWFTILGQDQFEKLPKMAKKYHGSTGKGFGTGICEVSRDDNFFLNFISTIYGLPKPTKECRFEAHTEVSQYKASWKRKFDGKLFESTMTFWNGRLIERFGLFSFAIKMDIDPTTNIIHYRSTDCWVLGMKLPKIFKMESRWKEEGTEDGWNFEGELRSCFGKTFGYKGGFTIKQLPNE